MDMGANNMKTLIIGAALLALTAATNASAGDVHDVTEKQALFAMITIKMAQAYCPSSTIILNLEGEAWAAIYALEKDQEYINNWTDSVTKMVGASMHLPTFCDDVHNMYGPAGIKGLPWSTYELRGLLK
jgi:hypothetical protein